MGLLCVFERRRPGADFLRARLQDARYVIDTITFFAVSCPENLAFFRKNRQNFENIPRKILHSFNILEKCCILEKSRKKLVKFGENLAKFWGKTAKNSAIFNEKSEIRERCKGVHCVDLGESFPTSIYLQKSASIQPRTSPSKFARSPCTDTPGRLRRLMNSTPYVDPCRSI